MFGLVFGLLAAVVVIPVALMLLLWLPFMLLRFTFRLAALIFIVPIVIGTLLFAAVAAGVAVLFAVLLPLVPIAAIVFVVWALTRSSRAATVIPG